MLCSIASMLFPPIKIIDSDVFYWENEFNQQFSTCYAVVPFTHERDDRMNK